MLPNDTLSKRCYIDLKNPRHKSRYKKIKIETHFLSLFKNKKYFFYQKAKVKTEHLKARGADSLVFRFVPRIQIYYNTECLLLSVTYS